MNKINYITNKKFDGLSVKDNPDYNGLNIDFKKFPKSYGKISKYFLKHEINFETGESVYSYYEKSLSKLCFCDFVKFFDSERIRIFILPYFLSIGNNEMESYLVLIIDKVKTYKGNIHKTRPEAESEAVYRALEILEKDNEF